MVMNNLPREFFMYLSENEWLNQAAQKWGLKLGASRVVAGTDLPSVTKSIRKLNEIGMTCTVDHLGEFVLDRDEASVAKESCLEMIRAIVAEKLDCHVSVKLTQIGLDVDYDFCLENIKEIVHLASTYDVFVNIDMEDYAHYEQTLQILSTLTEMYSNVGTVIQAYLFRAEDDLKALENVRLRIVKGAYKEDPSVSLQDKGAIDENFLRLIIKRLHGNAFTSIATHDHRIIEKVKQYVTEYNISKDRFEFQMLYGFRTDLQEQLVTEGYQFCTYVPFGKDWYGYFMRRLAERPQNLNLMIKDLLYKADGKMKKTPIILTAATLSFLAYRMLRKKDK